MVRNVKFYVSFVIVCFMTGIVLLGYCGLLLIGKYAPGFSDNIGLTNILTSDQPVSGSGELSPRPGLLEQALHEDVGMELKDFINTRSMRKSDMDVVTPGAEIHIDQGGNAFSSCSVGAYISHGGKNYMLTAGHCADSGAHDTFGQSISGRMFKLSDQVLSLYNGRSNDVMAVQSPYNPNTVRVAKNSMADLSMDDTQPIVGAPVCALGRTSGWRCGTLLNDNLEMSFCSKFGDSGGVIIQGNRIIGLVTKMYGDDGIPVCSSRSESVGVYNTGRTDVKGSVGIRLDEAYHLISNRI